MQTDLGGSLSDTTIVATYGYAARYVYSDEVVQNDNFLRLTAAADPYQTPISSEILTRPVSHRVRFHDTYGNVTHRSRITSPHQELTILSIGVVRFESYFNFPVEVALESVSSDWVLEEYLTSTALVHTDILAEHAGSIAGNGGGLVETVANITDWVYQNIQYVKESTTVTTTAEEVLASGMGVCQDMAHLAMGMLKALGIPCRYVCGLLTTEVGETHAWLEFWHPQQGWIPSDPTRGQAVATHSELLKFAVGRDYTEAAPVVGSFVSRGTGRLHSAAAQVNFNRDNITFDDAIRLIDFGQSQTQTQAGF